jgi:large subunit ribosomal protein L32
MAVQQNKKSPSKRGMHRAHDFITAPATAVEPTTGFYRGKKIIKTKADE